MAEAAHGSGIYFDGVSARRQAVAVDLTEDAVAIATPEGAGVARWPYAEVQRLSDPHHRLRLGLAGEGPPARLAIPDPAFAETVKERLGVRTAQFEAVERRHRHHVFEWTFAALAALLFLGVVGMPSLVDLALPLVPAAAEQSFGDSIAKIIRSPYRNPDAFVCGGPPAERAGQAAFLKLMGKLEAAAGLPVRLHPVVVRDFKTINASAGPGGYVYVQFGIIAFAERPEELAGILGHELGHVAHRDSMRSILHEAGVSFIFGVVLGDLFGSGGTMFNAANKVLTARHTRREEAAADAYAVELFRKMGQDPHLVALGFQHFVREGRPGSIALLADHPSNPERVAAILATPSAPVTAPPFLTPAEWQDLKHICAEPKTSSLK